MTRRRFIICIILFAAAAGVRILVWQNNRLAMSEVQYVVVETYLDDASLLLNGDLPTFVRGTDPPSDASVLGHPPGYPLFLAVVMAAFGPGAVVPVQILLVSLAAVIAYLIGAGLFSERVGLVAGILTAFSPQFAYYAGIVLPDELAALPILGAVYLLVLARERPRARYALLCGAAIGISCWLRANALFLPVFLCAGVVLSFPKKARWQFICLLLTGFVLSIAPITIRNAVVFGDLIPLSLGTGTTLLEGLGDMEGQGSRGVPRLDEEVMQLDVRLHGRPDYYGYLYKPDGVVRERERLRYGLGIIGNDPLWFAAGVLRRGTDVLRMERVPVIEPTRDGAGTTNSLLRYLNVPLRLFQRLFITAVFLPLALVGIAFLLWRREDRWKAWLIATVPVYYMTVQPLVHTEYRYLLPAAHVLVLFAAPGLVFLLDRLVQIFRSDLNSSAGA